MSDRRRGESVRPSSRVLACFLTLAVAIGLSQPAAAQLASKSAEQWIKTLDASNRVARLKIDETIAKLKIKPGEVIADIGAGSGVFSLPLAKAASPGGKVYAVDIDQGLIDHIANRAKELRMTNINTVLGKFTDPNLAATDVDLAFINDTLHHIEDRAGYLKTSRATSSHPVASRSSTSTLNWEATRTSRSPDHQGSNRRLDDRHRFQTRGGVRSLQRQVVCGVFQVNRPIQPCRR